MPIDKIIIRGAGPSRNACVSGKPVGEGEQYAN